MVCRAVGRMDVRYRGNAAPDVKNRLKVLRAERDGSQGDLADRLEISRQSVNAIETGRYDASLPLAVKIAELFDLAIEDISTSPSKEPAA